VSEDRKYHEGSHIRVYAEQRLRLRELEHGGESFRNQVRRRLAQLLAEEILSNMKLTSSRVEYLPYDDAYSFTMWADVKITGEHARVPPEVERAAMGINKMAPLHKTMANDLPPIAKTVQMLREMGVPDNEIKAALNMAADAGAVATKAPPKAVDAAAETFRKKLDEVKKNAATQLDTERPNLPTKGSG
jgi:hypothetical protein